jgi:hypothetical protein
VGVGPARVRAGALGLAAVKDDEQEERQKLAEARKQQFEKAMAFRKVLEELGAFELNRQG